MYCTVINRFVLYLQFARHKKQSLQLKTLNPKYFKNDLFCAEDEGLALRIFPSSSHHLSTGKGGRKTTKNMQERRRTCRNDVLQGFLPVFHPH